MAATLKLDFSSTLNGLNGVIAIVFLTLAVFFPVFSLWFLIKY